ncbi:GMP synthase [glutamine-hydrolyzing] [bacterium HR19]|nr:GMP synthase [glutamine-hydrolyzing] [bacterium HR19]
MILILDFGSQYTHLISRRIRGLGVYTEIVPFHFEIEQIKRKNPAGIILSGGPQSVYEENSPKVSKEILFLGIPVLGICYGAQLIAHILGGKVKRANVGEYGRTRIFISKDDPLFHDLPKTFNVWMSHGDIISDVPDFFEKLATTDFSPVSAFRYSNIYGVQFHPEVFHTEYGLDIIRNFVFLICKAQKDWSIQDFLNRKIDEIKNKDGGVICAVSGGVDSTTLAVILSRAKRKEELNFVLVDTGLLRKNEAENVRKDFLSLGIEIDVVNAEEIFLSKLAGIEDPEEKRKIIGKTFIEVFEKYAEEKKRVSEIRFLAQGTLYPDVIESGVSVSGTAHVIKTHHNVGGLPEKLGFELLEPFRELYKDEVREIGKILNIPPRILNKHPFPGPGLAVRIMGEVTREKLQILREAEFIFQNELSKWELYNSVWQAFCVLLNTKSTGVVGDSRRYGWVLAIRAVESADAMTADWARLPYEFLDEVARKIVASVPQISRVVYDITSKPPATIEWE